MMELPALADLLDVQEIDLALDRLRHKRATLPELEDYRRVFEDANRLEGDLRARRQEMHKLELEIDKAEGELEILEAKLKESETRLFAGGMNARETEHKRLEVQGLRGQRSAMEERVLSLLDLLDPQRETVSNVESAHARLGTEAERLRMIIEAAWSTIDAEISRKEGRRTEAAVPVPAELMELYEVLRQTKEGVAIARLDGGVCGGCHLALSRPEQAEAASYDPPRCVHCRRLLVL
jgi:hypothetical protein